MSGLDERAVEAADLDERGLRAAIKALHGGANDGTLPDPPPLNGYVHHLPEDDPWWEAWATRTIVAYLSAPSLPGVRLSEAECEVLVRALTGVEVEQALAAAYSKLEAELAHLRAERGEG